MTDVDSTAGVGGGGIDLAAFANANTVALSRFAFLLCGDRELAEDLVQDAFLSLYRRFGATLPVAAPLLYARRVIVNANVSHWRRRSSRETASDELPDTPLAAFDNAEQDAMWRALSVLPGRQRSVLVLRYYLDLPDREIGAILDCREGSVRSLATRAFAALRGNPDFAQMGTVR